MLLLWDNVACSKEVIMARAGEFYIGVVVMKVLMLWIWLGLPAASLRIKECDKCKLKQGKGESLSGILRGNRLRNGAKRCGYAAVVVTAAK